MNEWTIEKVKETIPIDVQVKVGETIVECWVHGRKNKFATVYPHDVGASLMLDTISWEFNWQAIVNSLNGGQPLIV